MRSASLLVPMTSRSSRKWSRRCSTNFGKWALGPASTRLSAVRHDAYASQPFAKNGTEATAPSLFLMFLEETTSCDQSLLFRLWLSVSPLLQQRLVRQPPRNTVRSTARVITVRALTARSIHPRSSPDLTTVGDRSLG